MSVNESNKRRNIHGSQRGTSLNQENKCPFRFNPFLKSSEIRIQTSQTSVTLCLLLILLSSTRFIQGQWVLHLLCAQCCLQAVISDVLSVPIQTLFLTTQLVTSFSHSLGMGYRQSHEALHLSSRWSGGRGRCHQEVCSLNKLLLSLQSWVSSLLSLLTHAK